MPMLSLMGLPVRIGVFRETSIHQRQLEPVSDHRYYWQRGLFGY